MRPVTIILVFVACAYARPSESPIHQNEAAKQETVADSLINDKSNAQHENHRVKRHFGLGGLLGGLFNDNDGEAGFHNDETIYEPQDSFGGFGGFDNFDHNQYEGFDDADYNGFGEIHGLIPFI